jgi:hypothetical protein
VDTPEGLTNGVSKALIKLHVDVHEDFPDRTRPLRIWIKSEEKRVGERLRQKQQFLSQRLNCKQNWTYSKPTGVD